MLVAKNRVKKELKLFERLAYKTKANTWWIKVFMGCWPSQEQNLMERCNGNRYQDLDPMVPSCHSKAARNEFDLLRNWTAPLLKRPMR